MIDVAKPTNLLSSISNDFLSKYQVALPRAVSDTITKATECTPLPMDFRPRTNDVVCGRGKGSYNKPGNRRFRSIIRDHVPDYAFAKTKIDKSIVLQSVIDRVKASGDNAMFVRFSKGRWYEISDDRTREKVGHCLRETMASFDTMNRTKEAEQHDADDASASSDDVTANVCAGASATDLVNDFLRQGPLFDNLRSSFMKGTSTLFSQEDSAALQQLLTYAA